MRTTDYITTGAKINTVEGYEEITAWNGSIVYTNSYVIDENDEAVLDGERMLTLEEIGHLLKDYDGKNHKVEWIAE